MEVRSILAPLLGRSVSTVLLTWLGLLILGMSVAWAQTLPAELDLRSAGTDGDSLVPAIQNQSEQEDCWTFATTTAMDSNLIKNGYLPTGTTAPPIALSSWYLSVYNGQAENTKEKDWGNWGGWTFQATSFITRGQGSWPIPNPDPKNNIVTMSGGPVLVSNNPLNAFPLAAVNAGDDLAPYIPPTDQPVNYIAKSAYYFDQAGSGRDAASQIDTVKTAIETYGAVATYMYAAGYTLDNRKEDVFFNQDNVEYELNPSNKPYDHAVTIIGWDDSIQVPGATGVGAWIVQNSWGSWGGTLAKNDGTFYAPYSDPYIGVVGVTAYQLQPSGKYSTIVLQNELGPTGNASGDTMGGNSNNPTGMGIIDHSVSSIAVSKLTVTSPATLLALGLTSLDAQVTGPTKTATITLYDGFNGTTGVFGTVLETQTITFVQEGYDLFDLTIPLDLYANEVLAVEVNYDGSSIPYVWEPDGADTDLTYYYTGSGWQDFATFTPGDTDSNDAYDGIFSVKGILAAVPEPSQYGMFVFLGLAGLAAWRRFPVIREIRQR